MENPRRGGEGSHVSDQDSASLSTLGFGRKPFADPIKTFMPWVSDAERELRTRILKARDLSAARAVAIAPSEAANIYWAANALANARLFAPAPTAELRDVVTALARLFSAARAIERLEGTA